MDEDTEDRITYVGLGCLIVGAILGYAFWNIFNDSTPGAKNRDGREVTVTCGRFVLLDEDGDPCITMGSATDDSCFVFMEQEVGAATHKINLWIKETGPLIYMSDGRDTWKEFGVEDGKLVERSGER